MTKKTILDTFNQRHEKVFAEKDAGVRLLNLAVLEKDLEKTIKDPKREFSEGKLFLTGIPTGIGAGMSIGSAIPDPHAIAGGALIGAIVGFFGSFAASMSDLEVYLSNKMTSRVMPDYLQNILPYRTDLKNLKQQVANEISDLQSEKNAMSLLTSQKLKKVLEQHPSLIKTFNNLQSSDSEKFKKATVGVKPAVQPQETQGLSL